MRMVRLHPLLSCGRPHRGAGAGAALMLLAVCFVATVPAHASPPSDQPVRAATVDSGTRSIIAHLVRSEPRRGQPESQPSAQREVPGATGLPDAVTRSWQGIYDPSDWPTAPTSAIGPTRYVEAVNDVINDGYAIYDRTHSAPLVKGSLPDLVSCGDSNCFNTSPSLMWDPTSNRFYYLAEAMPAGPGQDGHVMFGFSKTDTPGAGSTWCHYQFDVGANFPDRPQLGDSTTFMIFGYNQYDGSTEQFKGARLMAFVKPGSAPLGSCPSSLAGGQSAVLKDSAGRQVFAPAPANEVDSDARGWALARAGVMPSASLSLFQVTRAASGAPVFHTTGSTVAVPSYKAPSDAPQLGVPYTIDTGYGGPTHPVAAVDGLRGKSDRIWVSQAVAGGPGSVVRWFEIDPVAHQVVQSGSVTYPKLWAWNGAISPDRVNEGSTHAFGSSMVITYDTSSSTTLPTVYERGKVRNDAIGAAVKIVTANGADLGADCREAGHVCQWGGGTASPDPAAPPSGPTGSVWSVQMISAKGADPDTSSGMSWNFAAAP